VEKEMNGIIVPTCPRDYHWAYQLLDSAGPEENIIFIFSSVRDKNDFKRTCNYLIVPPKTPFIEAPPIYKKLTALRMLHDKYEYLSTLDSESLFLKPTTPYLKEIWDNNCLVANKSGNGDFFINQCLSDLGINDYPLDKNLYWWFNDIQVYPTKLIPEFLDWLPKKISFNSFDYLLFGIFLITKYNHQLRILDAFTERESVIERMCCHPEHRELVKQVNWSSWFPGVEKYDNLKMLFHLDRCPKLY
jgi:hypothetical protein